jgi:hypothetical protein
MRFEATIPDSRGAAVLQLAEELGLSRSQLIDEALALFLKAVLEVRKGRRLVTMSTTNAGPACEVSSPTLAALEWASRTEKLDLSADAVTKMQQLMVHPAEPGTRLRAAAKRHDR